MPTEMWRCWLITSYTCLRLRPQTCAALSTASMLRLRCSGTKRRNLDRLTLPCQCMRPIQNHTAVCLPLCIAGIGSIRGGSPWSAFPAALQLSHIPHVSFGVGSGVTASIWVDVHPRVTFDLTWCSCFSLLSCHESIRKEKPLPHLQGLMTHGPAAFGTSLKGKKTCQNTRTWGEDLYALNWNRLV